MRTIHFALPSPRLDISSGDTVESPSIELSEMVNERANGSSVWRKLVCATLLSTLYFLYNFLAVIISNWLNEIIYTSRVINTMIAFCSIQAICSFIFDDSEILLNGLELSEMKTFLPLQPILHIDQSLNVPSSSTHLAHTYINLGEPEREIASGHFDDGPIIKLRTRIIISPGYCFTLSKYMDSKMNNSGVPECSSPSCNITSIVVLLHSRIDEATEASGPEVSDLTMKNFHKPSTYWTRMFYSCSDCYYLNFQLLLFHNLSTTSSGFFEIIESRRLAGIKLKWRFGFLQLRDAASRLNYRRKALLDNNTGYSVHPKAQGIVGYFEVQVRTITSYAPTSF